MAAQAPVPGGIEPVVAGHAVETVAQARAGMGPAPHADVDVVPLRKEPPVALGEQAQVHREDILPARRYPARRGDVGFERDRHPARHVQAGEGGGAAVRAIGRHEDAARECLAAGTDDHARRAPFDRLDRGALAEGRAGAQRALQEEAIEVATLGEVDQRRGAVAPERAPLPEAPLDAANGPLGHRAEIEGQEPGGPDGHAAAARFVARELGLVEQQDGQAAGRALARGSAPRRPAADHNHIVAHELGTSTPLAAADTPGRASLRQIRRARTGAGGGRGGRSLAPSLRQ